MSNPGILIVDDDVEDHMVISEGMLQVAPSLPLYFKTNGVEALEFINELHEKGITLSLFVIDLNMPKMGGAEFLQKVKADERFSHIPVIIYSTSINIKEKAHCIALGAHSYITKPLSFSESIEISKTFLQLAKGSDR